MGRRRRGRTEAARVEAPSAPAPALPASRWGWAVPLLLALAVAAAYASVLDADFVNYDDQAYVTENRWITGGLQARSIAWAMTAFEAGNWHPLTWISHMADCQAFGLDPRGPHAINLTLHA